MTQNQEPVDRLIERSSLGTPAAKKLRARTPTSRRAAILRKAAARTRDSRAASITSEAKSNRQGREQMTDKPNVWVVRDGDGWAVRREGASRNSSSHDTQAEAIDQARDTARRERVELLWQGRDGKIQGRNSYGTDPHPPRG